jgi:hypothetical protein
VQTQSAHATGKNKLLLRVRIPKPLPRHSHSVRRLGTDGRAGLLLRLALQR